MVIPNFIDVEEIRAADISSMKKNLLRSPRLKYVFNDKTCPENNQGIGERLQVITKTQEADDLVALRPFSQTQRQLLQKCQDLVKAKAQELLETSQKIELVESVLMSKDNSHIQQELHPDLDKTYVSKALLAFISFEDHTTLLICSRSHNWPDLAHHRRVTGRYGLAAGSALFFHPLLVHAGDKYVKSNIRIHYYAFKEGTQWELDSRYELETRVAQELTHDTELVSSSTTAKIRTRAASEREGNIKRQKHEQAQLNFMVGRSVKNAAARVANEYTTECVENELASHLNELG